MTSCHHAVVLPLQHSEFIKCALWKSTQPGGGPLTPLTSKSHPAFQLQILYTSLGALGKPLKAHIHIHTHKRSLCLNLSGGELQCILVSSSNVWVLLLLTFIYRSGEQKASQAQVYILFNLITADFFKIWTHCNRTLVIFNKSLCVCWWQTRFRKVASDSMHFIVYYAPRWTKRSRI